MTRGRLLLMSMKQFAWTAHTELGVRGFVDAKLRALTEFVAHITGKYEVPIRSNVRVTNQQCLKCHPDAKTIVDVKVDVRHDVHIENEVLCADCHSRIVHAAAGEPKVIQTSQCDDCHNSHSGFSIQGKHALLRCSDCHTGGIYTGTPSECIDCHTEPTYHSGLPDCAQCHTTSNFSSSTYRHPRIEEHYPRGERQLSCIDCHKSTYSKYSCTGSGCHSSNTPRGD